MQVQVINFQIGGVTLPPPTNWREFQILSTYDDDNVEAVLDTDAFLFVNESAGFITEKINEGRTNTGPGIFQGLPFTFTVTNGTTTMDFTGYIDLTTVKYYQPNKVEVKVVREDINDIVKKLEGITFLVLKDAGFISASDYTAVNYLVEKEFNQAEFAILAITTFLMAKEAAEQTRKVANSVATVAGIAASGITGSVGALVYASLTLLVDIVYAVGIIIALIKLLKEIIEQVYPPVRTHQGMTFRKALEKAFDYFGYTFSSPIADLDWIYVPSKPDGARLNEGIPNPQDYGYRCSEMLALCREMFNARLRISGNNVELRSLNDPYWLQNTSFIMRDHLDEEVEYNTNEIVQTRLVSFTVDQSNFWTVQNYKGTAYEVTTKPLTPPVTAAQKKFLTIKGLDEIRFPVSLGSRKDGFTDVEKALLSVVKVIDATLSIFGTSSGLAAQIKNRAGLLRQGTRYHSIPQIVLLEGGKIPANYRDRLSARYLYQTYIYQKSLAVNNGFEQKRVYEERRRVMTLDSFAEAIKNKYFTTSDGKNGEFTVIKWSFDLDFAEVTYKVRERYTQNITEAVNEPA